MDNNKRKNEFNQKAKKVVKGVGIGVGAAFVAGAVLPVLPVSAPVLAVGGLIGGWIAHKKK